MWRFSRNDVILVRQLCHSIRRDPPGCAQESSLPIWIKKGINFDGNNPRTTSKTPARPEMVPANFLNHPDLAGCRLHDRLCVILFWIPDPGSKVTTLSQFSCSNCHLYPRADSDPHDHTHLYGYGLYDADQHPDGSANRHTFADPDQSAHLDPAAPGDHADRDTRHAFPDRDASNRHADAHPEFNALIRVWIHPIIWEKRTGGLPKCLFQGNLVSQDPPGKHKNGMGEKRRDRPLGRGSRDRHGMLGKDQIWKLA
jgi:hypothetical protein